MKELLNFLKAEEYDRCQAEINRENRLAIRLLARAGIPLSLANVLAQTLFSYPSYLFLRSSVIFLYFVLLAVLERKLLPQESDSSTVMLYLVELPPMAAAILLGTVWDPTHQAITFLMFIIAMPVFIIDRPLRLWAVFTGWTVLFVLCCMAFKTPETHNADLFHVLEFYLASMAVSYVVTQVRLTSLQSRERAQYHLEHDDLTNVRNRRSLEGRVDRYVGIPVAVVLADLDQLTLYNDFYGHEAGDELLITFTETIREVFESEDCYRFGGDEMLCVLANATEQDCLDRIDACRAAMKDVKVAGNQAAVTISFGYVLGTAQSAKQFNEMTQLADIYVHQANNSGRNQTVGSAYDEEHLMQGIVDSNRITHVRGYEINQLTGLPSMSYFLGRTDELMSSVLDISKGPCIGFVNLIRFREFNDTFGYASGDDLIAFTAKLLQQYFPSRHLCYITGSQFGILCYASEVQGGLEQVCKELESFRPGFKVVVKAGFAMYTGAERSVSLMDKARVAHDSIYDKQDQTYRFYDTNLDQENRFRQYLVNHVDEAAERGWLKVYYQPITRTMTGHVCDEEALSRWDDPVYGFLPPYKFIPALEQSRVIYKLNLHVVRQVLRDMETRKGLGVPIVPVSINLSRYDFEQADMVQEICALVDASGFGREMLKIEVTESAFVQNQELLKREIRRFREQGFEVWMDDFGSEYSTLNLLQELDFDLIKIDMQFMQNFTESGKNRIIVTNIIDMAKKMGITTLAEGVETMEQYRILKKLGCEKTQGFLFNKPNPLDYIVQRALNGTGLTFEKFQEEAYFREIGKIHLDMPFTSMDQQNHIQLYREMPTGILEYQNGALRCILGTDRFAALLEQIGLVSSPVSGGVSSSYGVNLTQELERAIRDCTTAERWVSFIVRGSDSQNHSFYLRQVTENPLDGRVALLAVLLPLNTQ